MKLFRKMCFWFFISASLCLYPLNVIEAKELGEKKNLGVVVISHGAPVPVWNQGILKLIGSVKSPYPLEAAFLDYDEDRTLEKSVRKLEEKGVSEILIIHLSPSSYSCHHEEVRYLAGLRKDLGIYEKLADPPVRSKVKRFVVSPCMDEHPLIVATLTDSAKELSENPEKESLILIGHGPVEELANVMWERQLKRIGKQIQKALKFRDIVSMTLRNDSANLIREQASLDLQEAAKRLSTQGRVIVLIHALGAGVFQKDVKRILREIPSVVISTKGIASHPNTVKWIEDTIRKGMNQPIVPPINRNWFRMDYEIDKPKGTYRYGLL